jgi:hypothetical protein
MRERGGKPSTEEEMVALSLAKHWADLNASGVSKSRRKKTFCLLS